MNDPKILFLDEPTIGLDPDVSLKTRQIILDILRQRRMTVLLTSHNMDEVESMCERVAFIQKGRIIKLAAVDELKRLHHTDDLEEIFIQLAHQTEEKFPSSPHVCPVIPGTIVGREGSKHIENSATTSKRRMAGLDQSGLCFHDPQCHFCRA